MEHTKYIWKSSSLTFIRIEQFLLEWRYRMAIQLSIQCRRSVQFGQPNELYAYHRDFGAVRFHFCLFSIYFSHSKMCTLKIHTQTLRPYRGMQTNIHIHICLNTTPDFGFVQSGIVVTCYRGRGREKKKALAHAYQMIQTDCRLRPMLIRFI